MSVNSWDILQLIFMIWIASSVLVISISLTGVLESKKPVQILVGVAIFWTLLVLIGGFLYYKNVETKCMYDPGFQGPCIERNLS